MKKVAYTIAAMSIGQFIVNSIIQLKKFQYDFNSNIEVVTIQFVILKVLSSFWIMIMLYLLIPKQMYFLCIPDNTFNPELHRQDIKEFHNTRILSYIKIVTLIYLIHFLHSLIY